MNWASFQIIEVMSQERFGLKRIGFLAAAQSFHDKTDVIVLTTALLKKEFSAKSPFEIGLAINTLANIATEDLARDLLSDVVQMLTSSRPFIRKKATLVLYKLYMRYPQGLRLTFEHLKRRISDDVVSVVSCSINVICELARKKPSNYLALAPELFQLLTTSQNNWMLIKIAKLMSALVQEEPRLARKLLEPLANIVQNTPAKSLMYECISTLTYALQYTKKADGTDAKNVPAVVRLCTDRLREFVRDPDQNLKYLGLTGLVSLMKSHPRVVAEHRELVLQCLTDEDVTIRLRALELISGMVTRKNLEDIVKSLMGFIESAEGHYRDQLIEKIIFMCSRDKYAYLADFEWYVGVLAKLAYVGGAKNSATVAGQLLDVAVRVDEVRPCAVQTLLPFLGDPVLFQNARLALGGRALGSSGAPAADGAEAADAGAAGDASSAASFSSSRAGEGQVLYAAAWTVGEYCSIIPAHVHAAVIDALLSPSVSLLPPAVVAVYVQCALKVVAAAAQQAADAGSGAAAEACLRLATIVVEKLQPMSQSADVEVQERACLVQQLLATLGVPYAPPPPSATAVAAAAAAAAAKAESDLVNLMSGAGAAAAAPAAASSGGAAAAIANALPPLEFNVARVAAVLSSLFSEPLKPVNPTAQKRVPVPEGLDLDAWINPQEKDADKDEKTSAAYIYASISFEDSYGMNDEDFAGGEDEEGGGRRGRRGNTSKPLEGGVGNGADEEDDEWFSALEKKNKRRDKELWGGDDEPKKGKKGKGKKGADEDEDSGARSKGRGGAGRDPFMLKSDGARGRGATGHSNDLEVDSIPIKTLEPGALKVNALDVNIFGDFGKKGKAAAIDEKGAKKGKKSKKGEDAPAPAGRNFRIMSDDEMPEGASAEKASDDLDRSVDALTNVDLTTPLGDDEVLVTRGHRSVGDPAALRNVGKKGKGRARVLGSGEDAPAAAAEPEDKKKAKKKADKEDDKPAKKDKGDKGDKEKAGGKEGKAKKEEKEDKPKKKKAEAAAEAAPGVGESAAAEAPFFLPLCLDKVIRLSYAVSGADPAGGSAMLTIRVEAKSAKKTVDWVDVSFEGGAAVLKDGGADATAGAAAGSFRIVAGLKAKDKEKPKASTKKGSLAIAVADALASFTLALKVSYLVTGAKAPATIEGAALVRAASLLVPHAVEQDKYKAIMMSEGPSFITAAGLVPLITAGAATPEAAVEATFAAILGVLRAACVNRAPGSTMALLYAMTSGAAPRHIAGLLKADGGNFQVTIKSSVPEHAAKVLGEISEAIKIAAAEAVKAAKRAGKDDDE